MSVTASNREPYKDTFVPRSDIYAKSSELPTDGCRDPARKMNSKMPDKPSAAPGGKAKKPEWADGLRHLYDAVVEEPLPDSFKDLLAKLDAPAKGGSEQK